MSHGLERWAEQSGEAEVWFARVELNDGQTTTLLKSEYDAAGYSPPFWQLRKKRPPSYSSVVAEGMKRVCKDFTAGIAFTGFTKTGRRLWTRVTEWSIEAIYFHRQGSSYGAPICASVGIRVMLSVRVLNDPEFDGGVGFFEDAIPRRPSGASYHHRFNAETWDLYQRCVDDLVLYVSERAEPWFAELRDPQKLLAHPALRPSTRKLLEEAIAGRLSPENYAISLKAMGVKRGRGKAKSAPVSDQ